MSSFERMLLLKAATDYWKYRVKLLERGKENIKNILMNKLETEKCLIYMINIVLCGEAARGQVFYFGRPAFFRCATNLLMRAGDL